jgi:AcrR family transcriptional regulator
MSARSVPPPRSRDAARTRDAILRAAQQLFAQKGYSTTGVREVAAAAGVDSTLVRRYFKSKEGLLRAAVEDMLRIDPFVAGSHAEFGARAVATLLHGETRPNALAMMILSTADPAARDMCRELMHERIVVPLAAWLGRPDAMQRAAQLNLLWMGFMTARQILPLQPLSGAHEGSTLQWLEAVFQDLADGKGEESI